jgi:hypothetical protein
MDKSKLKQLYSKFLLLPFPLSEGHKKAADWIAKLAEVDGFYAGLAESLIMDKPVEVKELPSLKSLASSLRKLQHEPGLNEDHYREYKLYLSSLEKLAKEIEKVI